MNDSWLVLLKRDGLQHLGRNMSAPACACNNVQQHCIVIGHYGSLPWEKQLRTRQHKTSNSSRARWTATNAGTGTYWGPGTVAASKSRSKNVRCSWCFRGWPVGLTHPILSDNVRAARKGIMGDFACRPAFYDADTDTWNTHQWTMTMVDTCGPADIKGTMYHECP